MYVDELDFICGKNENPETAVSEKDVLSKRCLLVNESKTEVLCLLNSQTQCKNAQIFVR